MLKHEYYQVVHVYYIKSNIIICFHVITLECFNLKNILCFE